MTKNILIIGGGISGLALLHYLKKKHCNDKSVDIVCLEKNDHLGGTIRSIVKEGCLFETGPNGFLDSKQRTLDLVREIGLDGSLIKADEESKIRYLSIDNSLHQLPSSPKSFLSFKPLKFSEKIRVLGEFFVPKKSDPSETVYDFGKRRLGEKFSQVFLDPMVSGIFGGDAKQMNLKAVFPRIYSLEEEHGSLFKAMIKIRRARKSKRNGQSSRKGAMGAPTGVLTSFQNGIEQLIKRIGEKYEENIRLDQEIRSVLHQDGKYAVMTASGQQYTADEVYFCAPAYSVGPIIKELNPRLSDAIAKVRYAPIAVIGLVYPAEYFSQRPKGYGYLIPSSEKKEILGVLFESNIFPGRSREDQILFRIMIGGARHPDILSTSKEELIRMAVEEIETSLGAEGVDQRRGDPKALFYVPWAKAIPQYDLAYSEIMKTIEDELDKNQKIHLVANYLKGVSLNDCIENAYQGAQASSATEK